MYFQVCCLRHNRQPSVNATLSAASVFIDIPSSSTITNTIRRSYQHPTTRDTIYRKSISTSLSHMGDRKKSKGSKYLRRAFGSAPGPAIANGPPSDPSRGQSNSDPQPEQSSGEHGSQPAALSPPTSSRSSRLLGKFNLRPRSSPPSTSRFSPPSPPPPPTIEQRSDNTSQTIATPAPQSPVVQASVIAQHEISPLTARTNAAAVSSVNHGPPSSSDTQCSPLVSTSAPIIQISHSQSEPTSSVLGANALEPSPHSSLVWAKSLDIAKTKLDDNNLPPLDLTNLTSQSAEENIKAVIGGLITAQQDDKIKRWSYTWRGKKVIVVERLGQILKRVEKYSKVVDIAVQSNPQVTALVWAAIWTIMRVCIQCTLFGRWTDYMHRSL